MNFHRKLKGIVSLTLILTLLLGAASGAKQSFNFAWPAPSEGTVTWSIQADDVTLITESDIKFKHRTDNDGFALVTQHQELVRVLGVSKEQERAMLEDPKWILARSMWPTYLISYQGELQGLADVDLLTQKLIASTNDAAVAENLKQFVRSERYRQAVHEQVKILWEGLVGVVAGIALAPGESISRSDEFPVHGVLIPVRITTRYLGPDQEINGAVRLQTIATFDEVALKAVISRTLSSMLPRERAGTVNIERMRRKIVVENVISPDTLLPYFGRISEEVVMQAANHRPVTSKQVQTFEFTWEGR